MSSASIPAIAEVLRSEGFRAGDKLTMTESTLLRILKRARELSECPADVAAPLKPGTAEVQDIEDLSAWEQAVAEIELSGSGQGIQDPTTVPRNKR